MKKKLLLKMLVFKFFGQIVKEIWLYKVEKSRRNRVTPIKCTATIKLYFIGSIIQI